MSRTPLILEFLILFIVLPLAYRCFPVRIPALPLLWIFSGYALAQLLRDPRFDPARLWNASALAPHLTAILLIFLTSAVVLWSGVHFFAPALEWNFVRANPVFWAIVMVAYPILSVYPQGILYRAFFFERYAVLFPGKWTMIVASAAAFAFLHIIFRNSLAVALTFAGGLLFAARYAETRSLFTSSFEHTLYGCWIFTIGLGPYFYHGTITAVGKVLRQ